MSRGKIKTLLVRLVNGLPLAVIVASALGLVQSAVVRLAVGVLDAPAFGRYVTVMAISPEQWGARLKVTVADRRTQREPPGLAWEAEWRERRDGPGYLPKVRFGLGGRQAYFRLYVPYTTMLATGVLLEAIRRRWRWRRVGGGFPINASAATADSTDSLPQRVPDPEPRPGP